MHPFTYLLQLPPLHPSLTTQALGAAGKLGAQLALELVGYDSELKAAMAYVFGNAFICKVRP